MMNPTRRCIIARQDQKAYWQRRWVGLGANATFAKGSPQRANKAKMEKWMSTWMDSLSAVGPTSTLSLSKTLPTSFSCQSPGIRNTKTTGNFATPVQSPLGSLLISTAFRKKYGRY